MKQGHFQQNCARNGGCWVQELSALLFCLHVLAGVAQTTHTLSFLTPSSPRSDNANVITTVCVIRDRGNGHIHLCVVKSCESVVWTCNCSTERLWNLTKQNSLTVPSVNRVKDKCAYLVPFNIHVHTSCLATGIICRHTYLMLFTKFVNSTMMWALKARERRGLYGTIHLLSFSNNTTASK